MDQERLETWLRGRVPPIPEPFLTLLAEVAGHQVNDRDPGGLGLGALSRALGHPGRNRATAFDLLAADAFITYACEEASRDPNPTRELLAFMTRIGSSSP